MTIKITIEGDFIVTPAPPTDTGAFGGIVVEPPPPAITWAPYQESMTAAQWNVATGLVARQIINPWDFSKVVFTNGTEVTQLQDKSGNNANLDVLGLVNLVIDGTRNVIKINLAVVGSDDLSTYLTGNTFDKPFVAPLFYKITSLPAGDETLWSAGSASAAGYKALSITSSGQLKYTASNDAGVTHTVTSTDAVPLGVPIEILLLLERSRVRVLVHGGTKDHVEFITSCGGTNTTTTITQVAIGGLYINGVTTQTFTSGFFLGAIFADGLTTNTYEVLEASASMFNIPFTAIDISTLNSGLVGFLTFPGPGGAAGVGDAVELISGTKFISQGDAVINDGKFHKCNAINSNSTTKTLIAATIPENFKILASTNFHLQQRVYVNDVSSHRTVWQIGSSPYVKLRHLGAANVFGVDFNGTVLTSLTTIANGNWYDIDIWCDNSNVVNFSVNGETPVTATKTPADLGSQSFFINSTHTPGFYWSGRQDDMVVWNRALTAGERNQNHNGGVSQYGTAFRVGFKQYLQSAQFNGTSYVTGGGGSTLRYLGSMIAGSGNANIQLKGSADYTTPNSCHWVTFIAPYSGLLREMIPWIKVYNAGGYSGGNGGNYELTVRNDNAGIPGSTIISKIASVSGFTDGNIANSTQYRRITFTTVGNVVAGTKYHLVVRNIDGNPNINWASWNTMEGSSSYSGDFTPMRPLWVDKDFMYHFSDNAYQKGTPMLSFGVDTDSNGSVDEWFGNPYADPISCYSGGSKSVAIGGSAQTRIGVKVKSSFQAVGFAMAGFRIAGTGNITATLKNTAGTTLATATIPGAGFNQTAVPVRPAQPFWSSGLFDVNPTLAPGTQYYIVLSAPIGATIHPCIFSDTASSLNGNFLANMEGKKGGWFGTSQKLESSTNGGSSWGTYGNGQRDMSFYLSGY